MEQLTLLGIKEPIVHPTNRVWPGTPNSAMPTIAEAYEDGKRSGHRWPKDQKSWQHIPGGPFVHNGSGCGSWYQHGDPFAALCAHSQRVHKAWMSGWHKGFQEANVDSWPAWYKG